MKYVKKILVLSAAMPLVAACAGMYDFNGVEGMASNGSAFQQALHLSGLVQPFFHLSNLGGKKQIIGFLAAVRGCQKVVQRFDNTRKLQLLKAHRIESSSVKRHCKTWGIT